MMRKLTLFLAALCGLCGSLQAQYCGFDQIHRELMRSSPLYSQRVTSGDARLARMIQANSNSLLVNTPNGPIYEIPVVIHVVHTGGTVGSMYNPADATLQGMIDYLNATYAATWPSYPSATTGGTAFPVKFVLAKRAPNCGTTGGIVRVNGSTILGTNYTTYGVKRSGANGIDDDVMKAVSKWDHNDYYNIWVVNRIDGSDGTVGTFVAGYATFAGSGADIDGTVMLATQAGPGMITLPHEIGHAFNLYHVFQGDDPAGTGSATTCPTNTNCLTDGDMVCDTEPMRRTLFTCPGATAINICTGVPYANGQRNFMDYSSCQDRFTAGQRTRFMDALTTMRAGLISSMGTTAPGTAVTTASCAPTITNPSNTFNAGVWDVLFNDMAAQTDGGYNWDGNQHYIDRSCSQQANVTAGQPYTIKVMTGPAREYVRVYIDYNNDGVFNTTTELAYTHDGTASTPYEVHTGTVTIPSTAATCVPLRMRVMADRYSTGVPPTPCGALAFGQAEDYSIVVKPARPAVTVAFATGSANPSCAGSPLSFNATTPAAVTSPVWRWYVNGFNTGVTGPTFTHSTLANGDIVTAILSFTTTCGVDSVAAAGVVVIRSTVVTPTVSIAISSGSNPGCFGTPISFSATPTNGGSAPTYQWYVGTTLQSGVTGSSFTSSSLPCNSSVSAVLTSSSSCASNPLATSNAITYTCGTFTPSVTVSVTNGTNPTCVGRAVTFSANPVFGGSTPSYQWFVNGVAVPGATGVSYTSNAFASGDSVVVEMTSNFACATATTVRSRPVYITIIAPITPVVAKMITAGSNPGCIDSFIQFTATAANAGANPVFTWFVNGSPVAAGPVYGNRFLNNGDRVWVRLTPSGVGAACYTVDTVYSDTTVLQRRIKPALPYISFIGHDLVSDSANVQWYGPAGLIPGAVGPVYSPTVIGSYYAVISNPLCGTGKSNILIVNPLSISGYNMDGVSLYPNPTTGRLTITWTRPSTSRITVYTPAGQAVLRDMAAVATNKVVDLSALASGVYFVKLEDEHGNSGTIRVTVAH